MDALLGRSIISGSLPFNLLDNVDFGMFVECLSQYQYNLPSRAYMTGVIIPLMYKSCKDAVTQILRNVHHIALTTDAWQ